MTQLSMFQILWKKLYLVQSLPSLSEAENQCNMCILLGPTLACAGFPDKLWLCQHFSLKKVSLSPGIPLLQMQIVITLLSQQDHDDCTCQAELNKALPKKNSKKKHETVWKGCYKHPGTCKVCISFFWCNKVTPAVCGEM